MTDPLAVPNKILFAGDWHGDLRWAVRVIDLAHHQNADVIIQLGDFGYGFRRGQEYLRSLSGELAGTRLLVVDGNHEDHDALDALPLDHQGLRPLDHGIWHLPRGFRWTWDGVRFLALGGAASPDRSWRTPRYDWWPQEELTEEQVARAIDGGPADVMVSHDCPTLMKVPGIEGNEVFFPAHDLANCERHRLRLDAVVRTVRPWRILHGHFHSDYEGAFDLDGETVHVSGLGHNALLLEDNVRLLTLDDLRRPSSDG